MVCLQHCRVSVLKAFDSMEGFWKSTSNSLTQWLQLAIACKEYYGHLKYMRDLNIFLDNKDLLINKETNIFFKDIFYLRRAASVVRNK